MALIRQTLADTEAAAAEPDLLMGDLDAADPAVRRKAVRLLGGRREAGGALAARLRMEREPSVVEALLTALGRTGGREAVTALLDLLRDEDASRRNGAVETLQEMNPDDVLDAVAGLLDDADSDVRIFALGVLHRLRHVATAELARRVIARDPHVNVCAAAVEVLAEIGTPDMVADLAALAARFKSEPFMAFAVTAAIRRIA
jgi:HEAT repeat protein